MTQAEINEREWNNPSNWSQFLTYSSRRDNRLLVPKRVGFGRTINFGNKNGRVALVLLLVIPALILAGAWMSGGRLGRK